MPDSPWGTYLCKHHLIMCLPRRPLAMKKLGFRGFSEETWFQPHAPQLPSNYIKESIKGGQDDGQKLEASSSWLSRQIQGVAEVQESRLCFHCRGHRSDPWLGSQDFLHPAVQSKKKWRESSSDALSSLSPATDCESCSLSLIPYTRRIWSCLGVGRVRVYVNGQYSFP